MNFHRNLEMSIAREEFFRLLAAAVGTFEADGNTIRGHGTACGWTIRLTPLAGRRVGSMDVPRHQVEIVLDGCAESEAEAFMQRFHRAFLRGGG